MKLRNRDDAVTVQRTWTQCHLVFYWIASFQRQVKEATMVIGDRLRHYEKQKKSLREILRNGLGFSAVISRASKMDILFRPVAESQ